VEGDSRLRSRKVVFVINAAIVGGAERHATALARGLEVRGFTTHLFALRGEPDGANATFARRLYDLRAFVQDRAGELVIAVNERPALLSALAGLRRGARVAGILHSTLPRNGFEQVLRLAHLPALYALDLIVFVSERQRAHWRRTGLLAKCETIRNGVDLRRFSPDAREKLRGEMRSALGFAECDVVAAFCAVLRPEKNPAHFLEALAALRREGAPAKGLVIGDGASGASVRAQISALSLEGAVSLVGMREDVRPYLAAADFGVNCSVSIETLSLSALETLAMGLPMAMSDIGGAGEIVDERNGVLFRPGDVGALKAAMGGLFDPGRRREAGLAGRARAVAEFDEAIMFDRYAETFHRLIG
jgi:glycosyltransferase involved in cell wall biosynthesis